MPRKPARCCCAGLPSYHVGHHDPWRLHQESLRRRRRTESHHESGKSNPRRSAALLYLAHGGGWLGSSRTSLLLASALTEHKVPFELHLFNHDGHGTSTCTREVNTPNAHNRAWVDLCTDWLADLLQLSPVRKMTNMKIMFYTLRPFDEQQYCEPYKNNSTASTIAGTPGVPTPENLHLAEGCDAVSTNPCEIRPEYLKPGPGWA